MAGWHHQQCNGHELQTLGDGKLWVMANFERWQNLGDAEGQGGLAWGSPWGRKESDMTG